MPDDYSKTSQPIKMAGSFLKANAPLFVFAALAGFLLYRYSAKIDTGEKPSLALSLSLAVGIIAFSLLVAYCVKILLLIPPNNGFPAPSEESGLRDRLARQVVTIGSVGIAIIGLVLIVAIALKGEDSDVAQSGLSIFTAILPVFSTWVGTVLAFYFTKESFRQAAESTQGLFRDSSSNEESITRPGTMVPYERIIRVELNPDDILKYGDATKAAESRPLKEFRDLLAPAGIFRVVIFDPNKCPVYVIRYDLMPPPPAAPDTQTIKTYLDTDVNRGSARNFAWTGRRATVADGRRLFDIRGVNDLFITDHGRADEPVIGWVPDENLKKAGS